MGTKVLSITEGSVSNAASQPPASSSLPTEGPMLEPPTDKERENGDDKKKKKAAIMKVEEKKKEAEIKVIKLEVRMLKSISEAAARAIKKLKASSEMKDLNITFDQKAFIKGIELCEGRMVRKFLELDLSFLEEEPDEEAGPSDVAADPSPIEVIVESSEPATEVPEPM
ncbi:hypothetical protein COCNU_08G000140 [Cocos nucifera]|uniref:Uncharacterized protein n=1 Tax=Cocos nucifera TaxID=13894 RepID=A0A8K0IGJ4_COCNU|nr:hypothetical protein COCNU_08G000140 [Cocos nucifera]